MEFAKRHSAQNGILFERKITFGDPGYTIVKFAKDKKFDVIVIGARGRGALKEIFFGSVSNYVLHKSNIPVLVVK
jgi:nucleotide-binding universal stress UspA family protein